MTQANDLPSRLNRAEDNIIDLRLAASALLQAVDKNSNDIAVLIEVSRRNTEAISGLQSGMSAFQAGMTALQLAQLRTEAALQVFQQHTDDAIQDIRNSIERLTASNERMEQLLEYVIRRDREQLG